MAGTIAAIAAGLGAGGGIGQAVLGSIDRWRSKKIREQSLGKWKKESGFEEYETPQSYKDFLGLTRTQARQQMPGYGAMKEDIGASTAQTLSQAGRLDPSSAAAVMLGAQQNRMRALRQLGIMASQYQTQAQQRYTQAVGAGATYEDKAYEYNQWLPWQMKMNEAMAYRGAGTQQIASGIDQMSAAGIGYANLQAQQNWYNNMNPYGQQNQQITSPWGAGFQPGAALEAQGYISPYNPYVSQGPQTPPAQASPYPQGSMGGFSGPNTYNW